MNAKTSGEVGSLAVAALLSCSFTAANTNAEGTRTVSQRWQEISAVKAKKAHMVPATWTD